MPEGILLNISINLDNNIIFINLIENPLIQSIEIEGIKKTLKWIDDNKELLKPPVGNKCVYAESEDFIIMVVGGPNSRKDYHYNETEEFFYQIKGDIVVRIQEEGKAVDVPIKEGEVFLLPAKVPHSPVRSEGSIGLVIECKRTANEVF